MKIIKKMICYGCLFAIIMLAVTIKANAKTIDPVNKIKYKPVVCSQITNKTTKITVYGYSNTTLYVKSGNKTLAKKYFKSEGLKTFRIAKQRAGSKIKFYLVNEYSKKKGYMVTKNVVRKAHITPLTAPKVSNSAGVLTIKGKIGCVVYIKVVGSNYSKPWYKYGTIINKSGVAAMPDAITDRNGYYLVQLKDIDGKKSPKTKVKVRIDNVEAATD